jgi:ABC-2 type transport system ATP-binding protein
MYREERSPAGRHGDPISLPSDAMDATITIRGLTKRYGTTRAVEDLTFSVAAGRVTGFVGPNGAGKSTTMRLILGLAAPDAGTALVGGEPYVNKPLPLREVGALLDATAIHPGRRARDHLLWLGQSNDIPRSRVDEVLDLVGLSAAVARRAGGFSLGMAQRLGLAAALLGDPPILMLDEPVNGLDPEGIVWIRGFLRSLAAEGRTVFVSSHLMTELQGTADHLVVIGRGRLIADVSVDHLLASASTPTVDVRTPDLTALMPLLGNAGASVVSADRDAATISGLTAEHIAELASDHRIRLYGLTPRRATLEEVYLDLTRDAVDHHAARPDRT